MNSSIKAGTEELAKTFLANVYMWMTVALTVTGLFAYMFATSADLAAIIYSVDPETQELGYTGWGWVCAFSPLLLIIIMAFNRERMSALTMQVLFIGFSIIMGISLSSIFMVYSLGSIYAAFFTTSITFLIMSLVGYTTKTDLTKLGALLFMALIGIIVAMIINWFLASPMLDYIISIIGVIVFIGLIAYDTQKLKKIGMSGQGDSKEAIWGAMDLYLDFINLFLFILRLFGAGGSDD